MVKNVGGTKKRPYICGDDWVMNRPSIKTFLPLSMGRAREEI